MRAAAIGSFIGDVFGDAADFASDAVDAVVDPISDAADWVTSLPGFADISDALKDFANTDVGKVVFKALASTLTGGLAPILGPQLATIAFAVPGLIRGERFDRAWLSEFQDRAQQTAQILGLPAAANLIAALGPTFAAIVTSGAYDAAWKVAIRLGLREDLTAWALAGLNRLEDDAFDLANFDLLSGKDRRVTDEQRQAFLHPGSSLYTASINKTSHAAELMRNTSANAITRTSAAAQVYAASRAEPPPVVRGVPVQRSSGTPTIAIVAGAGVLGVAGFLLYRRTKKGR